MPSNYYVSAAANGDGGNALTPATAKQHIQPVLYFLNRTLDQNMWIEAGYYYDVANVGAGLPTLAVSHVKIRRYGDASLGNPCLDGRNWIAPGSKRFTYLAPSNGGHVWKLQIGTANVIWRIWSQSTNNGIRLEDRTDGIALRRSPDATAQSEAAILAALNADALWHGADATQAYHLYIWTPTAEQDPADYYRGLSFIQSGAGTTGFDYGFFMRNCQDVLISGVDVKASRNENFIIFGQDDDPVPLANIRIDNCKALLATTGFRVKPITTAGGIAANRTAIFDVLFTKCIGDTGTSPIEQENNNLLYSRLSGASDMFYFTNRIENVRAEDCTSINGFHCGATFGVIDANSSLPKKTGFRRHLSKSDTWSAYTRGVATFNCEDSCFIDQCTIDGMNVRSQVSGGVLMTSTRFINSRKSIRKFQDTDGHLGIESFIGDQGTLGIGNERYVYLNPTRVRIYNCTFGPSYGTPIQFNAYVAGASLGGGLTPAIFAAGSVKVANCLFMDTRPERVNLPIFLTYNQTTMGIQPFENCALYKFGGAAPTVLHDSTTTNAAADTWFSNAITVDPGVDELLRPMAGSALIGAGKRFGMKLRDNSGREVPAGTAHIGAFCYRNAGARNSRK